jgi:hypothetical protein
VGSVMALSSYSIYCWLIFAGLGCKQKPGLPRARCGFSNHAGNARSEWVTYIMRVFSYKAIVDSKELDSIMNIESVNFKSDLSTILA